MMSDTADKHQKKIERIKIILATSPDLHNDATKAVAALKEGEISLKFQEGALMVDLDGNDTGGCSFTQPMANGGESIMFSFGTLDETIAERLAEHFESKKDREQNPRKYMLSSQPPQSILDEQAKDRKEAYEKFVEEKGFDPFNFN